MRKTKRRSYIRSRRRTRRGPWRSEKYRRYVASLPCLICQRPEVQAAHTENNGMRSKGPDSSCVPLCPSHHDELDGRVPMLLYGRHVVSNLNLKEQFEAVHGVDLKAAAEGYFRAWEEKCHKNSQPFSRTA